MTDKHLAPVIKTWLQGTDRPPADSHRSTSQIMARLPEREKHRRWWPFPVLHRRTKSPSATDTTAYQPSPIPATNGHTPTVIGRTTSMLSPVKAITAGALVFAIGGVMLIAQPFQQQSSLPGAAIDPCTTPVVPVTGTIIWGGEGPDTQRFVTDSGEHIRNFVYTSTMSLSDDRLDGRTTATGDWNRSGDGGIYRGTRVIENADGTWEGPETLVGAFPSRDGFQSMSDLSGTGAYEGLSAVLFIDNAGMSPVIRGSIFPTDLASCDFSTGE